MMIITMISARVLAVQRKNRQLHLLTLVGFIETILDFNGAVRYVCFPSLLFQLRLLLLNLIVFI